MKKLAGLFLLSAAVALTACGRDRDRADPGEPAAAALAAPEGFQHDATFAVDGYYMPASDVKVGNFELNVLSMGAPSDFEAWEDGEREVFGPVMMDFDDVTSPVVTNELGAEGHEKTVRVKPAAYRLYPGEVSFTGEAPGLGKVTFVGRFNQQALADGRKDGSSGETPVLSGDLQVGDTRFEDVAFTYWIGD